MQLTSTVDALKGRPNYYLGNRFNTEPNSLTLHLKQKKYAVYVRMCVIWPALFVPKMLGQEVCIYIILDII